VTYHGVHPSLSYIDKVEQAQCFNTGAMYLSTGLFLGWSVVLFMTSLLTMLALPVFLSFYNIKPMYKYWSAPVWVVILFLLLGMAVLIALIVFINTLAY
jgi:RsiW-degrading membrane proteinase PrsW (M82 family)